MAAIGADLLTALLTCGVDHASQSNSTTSHVPATLHRVELMLSLLQLPTELIFVDLAKGEHKKPEFLAHQRFWSGTGADDQGVVLADSNAILVYLAQKYGNGRWLPDRSGRVQPRCALVVGRCRADCLRPRQGID